MYSQHMEFLSRVPATVAISTQQISSGGSYYIQIRRKRTTGKTRHQISYQNLTPKVEPNLIPKVEPKVEPKPLQYNVRALDKDKDKDKDNSLSPPRAYEEIPTGIFERGLDEIDGRRFIPPEGYSSLTLYNELKRRAESGDEEAGKMLMPP